MRGACKIEKERKMKFYNKCVNFNGWWTKHPLMFLILVGCIPGFKVYCFCPMCLFSILKKCQSQHIRYKHVELARVKEPKSVQYHSCLNICNVIQYIYG